MTPSFDKAIDLAFGTFPADRVAYFHEEHPRTFAMFHDGVAGWCAGLASHGIRAGSKVGYALPNGPEPLEIFCAISRLGACAIPLFPRIPDEALLGIFLRAGADLVVVPRIRLPALAELSGRMGAKFRLVPAEEAALTATVLPEAAALPPEAPLLAASSSGTTGIPKPVVLSRGNVAASVAASMDFSAIGPWSEAPDYTSMGAFPMSTSGILVLVGQILSGARIVSAVDPSPVRYLELASLHQARSLAAPPAYLEAILALPPHIAAPLPSVRLVQTGMDFLSPSLLQRLRRIAPNLSWVGNGYGLVETGTVFLAWKRETDRISEAGCLFETCGIGLNEISVRGETGVPVAFGDEGELWVRGESVFSGYGGVAGDGLVDGWFRTGDVVRLHAGNRVELRGRRKYLIKRGGKSVSPLEVQETVESCPGVLRAAVAGVPHPLYGEMVWAFVVAERGREPSLGDLMRHCRAHLPVHMVPDQVRFLDSIPQGTGVGKVDRESLIRSALQELSEMKEI